MLTFTFYVDESKLKFLEKQVPIRAKGIVQTMAEDAADFIRANWSAVSPSSPGNAPAVVTGTLNDSVTTDQTGRDALGRFATGEDTVAWSLQVKAPYAGFLEPPGWLDRPYFQPAIDYIISRSSDYYRGIFDV